MVLNEIIAIVNKVVQYSNVNQPDNIVDWFGELHWFIIDTEKDENPENEHSKHADQNNQILDFEGFQMSIVPQIEFITQFLAHML